MVKRRDKRTNNNLQKITQKTKDRAARIPSNFGGKISCSGRVISSCSTCDTRSVTFVKNPVISHEWRTYWIVFKTNGTYTWSLRTQTLRYITVVFPVLLSKVRFFFFITPSNKIGFIKDHHYKLMSIHVLLRTSLSLQMESR